MGDPGVWSSDLRAHLDGCSECRELAVLLVRAQPASQQEGSGAHPAELLGPGSRIGPYRLDEILGVGGSGVVFAAEDVRLGREVALKLLRIDASLSDARRQMLVREARAMARLSHPRVIEIHELLESEGMHAIAMPRAKGGSLSTWIEAAPRASEAKRQVILDAADGLSAVHSAGLLHRDIKPRNILIDENGRAQVGDLGLAALLDGQQAGSGIGTPLYHPPEVKTGGEWSQAGDQYALALIASELLYPDAAASASPSIRRALSVDPAQRWPSVASFAASLRAEWQAVPKGGPRLWHLALALVAVVGLVSVVLATRARPSSKPETVVTQDELANQLSEARSLFEGRGVPSAPEEALLRATEVWRQAEVAGRDRVRLQAMELVVEIHESADRIAPVLAMAGLLDGALARVHVTAAHRAALYTRLARFAERHKRASWAERFTEQAALAEVAP